MRDGLSSNRAEPPIFVLINYSKLSSNYIFIYSFPCVKERERCLLLLTPQKNYRHNYWVNDYLSLSFIVIELWVNNCI